MPNHTPGPWRFKNGIWIVTDKDLVIARVLPTLAFEANGPLIAAAPEMQAALADIATGRPMAESQAIAEAALAKSMLIGAP